MLRRRNCACTPWPAAALVRACRPPALAAQARGAATHAEPQVPEARRKAFERGLCASFTVPRAVRHGRPLPPAASLPPEEGDGMFKRAKIFWEPGLRTGRPCNVRERDPPNPSVRSIPDQRKSAPSTGVRMLPGVRTSFLSESSAAKQISLNSSRIRSDEQRVMENGHAGIGLSVAPVPSPPHPR